MKPKIDMLGQKFDRLTVLEESEKKYPNNEALWKCQCRCGKICHIAGSALRHGLRKSCGCMWRPHSEQLLMKLKLKLEKNSKWNKLTQCQEWTGYKNRQGYGKIHITEKTMDYVHKISWLLHISRIPKGYEVTHKCGNILCFRPEHLELLKKD